MDYFNIVFVLVSIVERLIFLMVSALTANPKCRVFDSRRFHNFRNELDLERDSPSIRLRVLIGLEINLLPFIPIISNN